MKRNFSRASALAISGLTLVLLASSGAQAQTAQSNPVNQTWWHMEPGDNRSYDSERTRNESQSDDKSYDSDATRSEKNSDLKSYDSEKNHGDLKSYDSEKTRNESESDLKSYDDD